MAGGFERFEFRDFPSQSPPMPSVYILANIGTLEANSKEILSFEKVVKNHDAPYSIIIPGDKEWVVIISSDVNNWGTSGYSKENTVASITVPVTEGKESLEAFSIAFEKSKNGVHMHMGWGTIRVAVPFTK